MDFIDPTVEMVKNNFPREKKVEWKIGAGKDASQKKEHINQGPVNGAIHVTHEIHTSAGRFGECDCWGLCGRVVTNVGCCADFTIAVLP